MIISQTKRLILRKFDLDDAIFFKTLTTTPKWLKYIGDRNIKTLDDARENLKKGSLKSYREHGFGLYVLELKDDNRTLIGACGLIKREQLEHVDIGFALLPEYEGQGFGYESAIEVVRLAKKKFKLKKLFAITLPINVNSINLINKLGFKLKKIAKPFDDDKELLLFAKTL
jgi:RimJ/RimL family protein N-acetyltransferase